MSSTTMSGRSSGAAVEQGAAVGHRPDHVAVGLEQLRERLPEQSVIVRQQDTRAPHGSLPERRGHQPVHRYRPPAVGMRSVFRLAGGAQRDADVDPGTRRRPGVDGDRAADQAQPSPAC